jgi:radical SAM superfamily enzyme YgiQ (UPF0313 family)
MGETRFLLEPVQNIIAQCRAFSNAVIVIGGAGFSIFPHAVLRYLKADMGGEMAFTTLIKALERIDNLPNIGGLCFPGKSVQLVTAESSKLDILPLPDPSIWSVPSGAKNEIWIPHQTRRGCPMKCTYCSTPALEGKTIRKHSVDASVEGFARHMAAGFSSFYFVDNTFNYTKELCTSIISAHLGIQKPVLPLWTEGVKRCKKSTFYITMTALHYLFFRLFFGTVF